jgi:hypothetical protein
VAVGAESGMGWGVHRSWDGWVDEFVFGVEGPIRIDGLVPG